MERERLSQQAAQSAAELAQRSQEAAQMAKARQDQVAYEHLMEQQKLAVEQAYQQQQVGLKQQDNDLAEREFQKKITDSANRFAANQAFQKALLPKEQGGEGLDPEKAALKYIAPYMTGTEVGRLASAPGPFSLGNAQDIPGAPGRKAIETSRGHFQVLNLPEEFQMGAPTAIPGIPGKQAVETSRGHYQIVDVPSTVTNAPAALPVKGDDDSTIGYITQIPGEKPHFSPSHTSTSDLSSILKARQKGTNAPAAAPAAEPAAAPLATDEVIRTDRASGRRAVFDGKTKKFLRWLDAAPISSDDSGAANAD
jgi:hypothetical protein